MKQSSFWEKQEIVKDREKIRAYLAKCREVLSGAARPHTGAWYWRKTDWNEYTLVGGSEIYRFSGYPMLHKFCEANNINATQT